MSVTVRDDAETEIHLLDIWYN